MKNICKVLATILTEHFNFAYIKCIHKIFDISSFICLFLNYNDLDYFSGEAGGSHRVTLLEKFSEKVRVELKASMRKLSEKISQLSQLEKTAWSNLDKLEVKVKEMNEEVDEVAEKQVVMAFLNIQYILFVSLLSKNERRCLYLCQKA